MFGLTTVGVLSALWLDVGTAGGGFQYEVTITNLTRGQIFSPAVVATHKRQLQPLFTLGSPASDELVAIAEDAVSEPLMTALSESSQVKAVALITGENGPILPGETASVIIQAGGSFRHVTLVGMLVTTNDAFYALNGVQGPPSGAVIFNSPGYDAGSENNNENCDFIPGPPCGNPGVRDTVGAEGTVHIHAGIHNLDDLQPSESDWRNPVATISIRRLNGQGDDDDDDDDDDD
ncbi:MAG: spondin domain-containing protein [Planctomycetota bacterium]